MSTSGIYTYSRTLNQIATESLIKIEALGDGETLRGYHIARAKDALNSLLISATQTQGLHLWTETEGTLFLKVGQFKYDFRDSSTHLANNFNETTTTADTTAATLTIPVLSIEGISDGDVIGIIQKPIFCEMSCCQLPCNFKPSYIGLEIGLYKYLSCHMSPIFAGMSI